MPIFTLVCSRECNMLREEWVWITMLSSSCGSLLILSLPLQKQENMRLIRVTILSKLKHFGLFSALHVEMRMKYLVSNSAQICPLLFNKYFILIFTCRALNCYFFLSLRLFCGFGGALFVFTHRKIVDIQRTHKHTKVAKFLSRK